jgi:Tol biopolymer transport system component/DNA-binding winged helix-turn-helix (wHTH) protein
MISENSKKGRYQENGGRFAFDQFEVDAVNRILWQSGKEVPVTGKVFDILLVLVQNPGRLLTKNELLERVWHDEFVEEGNLARNISTLRKAIGDTGKEHKYIVTVQGQGYRFIGEVTSVDADVVPLRPPQTDKSQPPNTRSGRKWYGLVGLLMVSGLATIALRHQPSTPTAFFNPEAIEQIRLTTGGKTTKAAISIDGQHLAYVEDGQLKLRDLSGGDERIIVDSSRNLSYIGVVFSPDRAHLYFSAKPKEVSTVTLYRLPLSGGDPQRVLDDVYGNISFSPDGKKFSFVRRYPELNQNILIIADADGSNTRRLAISQRPNHFDGSPSWSPDGSTIVCPAVNTDLGFHFVIAAIRVVDGAVETIKTRRWSWLSSLVWLNDSRRLLIVAQDERAVNAQIWQLDRFTGDSRQLSDDSFIYESLSGTRDGENFVAVKRRLESHVWVGEQEQPVQVTTGFDRYDGLAGLTWDSSSRILFHSRASGRDAIWRMNANGGGSELLTEDGGSGFGLSPDGRFLVFQSMESNSLGLSRLDLTNGERKRLTQNSTDMTPSFTPDGRWIVYSHFAEKHSINKIASDGATPSKVFDEYRTVSSPAVSPNGKQIAFAFSRTQANEFQYGIAILSLADLQLVNTFVVGIRLGTIYERPTVQWSSDGQSIFYINYNSGVSNLWKVNIADGSTSAVTSFKVGRVYNFAYSSDGEKLALARGAVESDAVMIRLRAS